MKTQLHLQTAFFLVFVSLYPAAAQHASSSPYSVYGAGIMNLRTSSLNRAMGGSGIAVRDVAALNLLNPASYTSILSPVSHIYEFGMYGENIRYSTTNRMESRSLAGLSNINYWFRFRRWWAATLGIAPYSTVSYDITSSKTLAASERSEYIYSGSGSTTQLFMGNGFSLTKNLSVGFNLTYIFGSIDRSESIAPSTNVTGLTLNNKLFTNKVTLDYGIQYKFDLRDKKSIVIGAVYNRPVTFHGTSDITLVSSANDTLSNYQGKAISYTLPPSFGTGISMQIKNSMFTADAQFKQWTKSDFSSQNLMFKDVWRFSAGYAYAGSPDATRYMQALSFKAGLYYQEHYVILKDNILPDYGFTLGVGFPVLDGKSTIGLGYAYNRFGTTNDQLILQQSQKVMVDVIIRDIWGIRRKFD